MTDHKTIRANGIDFAYIEEGEGTPVLLLHGFPDTFNSFRPVMSRLAAAGFRAIAPALRGYAPTGPSADGDYSVPTLARDLIALLEHFEIQKGHVVGHDWGSVITQFAANLRPDRFERIVICAVPHLRKFFLHPSRAQLKRSHYIARFQAPMWAERRLPRNNFEWVEDVLWHRWSPTWDFTDDDINPVKANLADPRRLKAALAYYRRIPLLLANPAQLRVGFAKIQVPTLAVYGSEDGCIGPEMFQKNEKYFAGPFEQFEMKGRGHFMHAEVPAAFSDAVIEFLKRS